MTGVSTLAQALSQIDLIKGQNKLLTTLSTQMSTGKKTSLFAGLGSDVLVSQRSRADFQSLDTYQNNIKLAKTRIQLMLTSVQEFKAQARTLSSSILGLSQESTHEDGNTIYWDDPTTANTTENVPVGVNSANMDVDFTTLQDLASNLYDFMKDLVNTKDSGRYLLSGADTLTQPLVDNGSLDTKITSLLTNWKDETSPSNITTDQLISAITSRSSAQDPDAITDTLVGYSSSLSAGTAGKVFVRVSDTGEIDYTALANDPAFRDIMVGLSFMKNATLAPIADVFAEPYTQGDTPIVNGAPGADTNEMKQNFYQAFNAVGEMVANALQNIDDVVAKLESAQARIAEISDSYKEQKNALLTTISDVENVDTNEVAVRLTTLQTQLEASYRVTALLQDLSLANYLKI
jgi:flagellar hook-associated protein 3 FlgL